MSRKASWALSALSACVLALTLTASTAGAACPNEAIRESQGTTGLPGCRGLEMVSPSQKFSQPALLPSFSEDGQRLRLLVRAALAETPGYQYYNGDHYVASRTIAGWDISPTSPVDPTITAGGRRWGSAAAFTPQLDRWAEFTATQSQNQVGVAQLFGGDLSGSYKPLSPLLVPIDDSGTEKLLTTIEDLELSGAAADLSTSVLRVTLATTSYLPGDPHATAGAEGGGDRNSYVAFLDETGEPSLQLLARDKDGKVFGGRCFAHLGGSGATFDQGTIRPLFIQGAISPDGERIFFSARPAQPWDSLEGEGPSCNLAKGLRVLKRVATPDGPVITEIAPGGGGPEAPGDDLFQAASADGTKVYFLSPRKLTAADTDASAGPCSGTIGQSKGCDLYLYDESRPPVERITLASDAAGSEEAGVLNSTTAISGDGSRAYFVAQGVLTADTNTEGAMATANQPNLYVFEAGADQLSFIATLYPGDSTGMWDTQATGFGDAMAVPVHGAGSEDGGDGRVLAFAAKANVTSDDEDGGHRDVFRYDAQADTIERVSKATPGGTDNEQLDVFVNPAWFEEKEFNFGEATRWTSEDGQLIGFATKEPLVPGDGDEAMNPYLWEAGTLGAAFAPLFDEGGETRPPAVAPVGGQVAFSSAAALLRRDQDVVEDVYVARPDGGFDEPIPAPPCDPLKEGSCQGPTSPKPSAAPLTTTSPSGNVKPRRHKCKKGKVKRKGKCVKRKQRKGKARRAERNRGGRA